ncbi:MAG: lytic murein transglycosylase B [Sulfuritalea sp.]|nr:lytic murein transglycosylase B [Sulfuritalea sp.]
MKHLVAALLVLLSTYGHARGYAEREDVQAFIADMQARHGFDGEQLTAQFGKTRPIPAVLKAIAPPTDPRVKSWKNYRARFIEPKRTAAGLAFWQRHAGTLAKAEALTGVPAEIVVAIIGIETFYGRHLGRFDSFAALATLAFDYPPRAPLFRRELESLLLLAREENRPPDSYRGSFAGAIGLPQFLPSSIRAYAVDFDGDGRIDLTGSPEDAIGSATNFLKVHGWETGGPVAVKVGVGGTAHEALIAAGILPRQRPQEMRELGIDIPADAPDAPAALIDLVTPDAPTEYWLGYQNFYVITRYNRSSFYAMAVWHFAQALKGLRLQQ